jgi:ATP-binding cassette subfamily F protein uup
VFEGDGRVAEYVGGYDDWLRQRPSSPTNKTAADTKAAQPEKSKPKPKPAAKKLGYKEQRELEMLPKRIEELELELETIQGRMADPAFYQQEGDEIALQKERLSEVEAEVEQAFRRWEALENPAG